MHIDELPDGPRIGRPAAQRAGVNDNAPIPTDTLIQCVLAGDELHNSLRDLAMRGWSEEQLRELLERSDAKEDRPDDWSARLKGIPRLVASAKKKLAKRAEDAFGKPSQQTPASEPVVMPGAVALPLLTPADMARLQLKPREWIVADLLPKGEPSLLYGAGATGKSLLLLQLCIAMASGRKWLDRDVPSGRCLMFTCEDGVDELNRRGRAVLEALGAEWSDCGDRLALLPMRGVEADAVLASARNDGTLQPSATYEALRAVVNRFEPDVITIDTLADTFAGEENRRADAKAFVNLLVRRKRWLGPTCRSSS